jgi:hypothetical protein|tara:strand:+ start:471 stop:767 length:297 start_codon:yes stop_codon:yes gene_type:complete
MANILQFPEKTLLPVVIQGYRMSFYSETEIDLALLCVNTWGFQQKGYTRRDLSSIDPLYIKECLIRGYNSDLIALPGKKLINKIIDGMEAIEVPSRKM